MATRGKTANHILGGAILFFYAIYAHNTEIVFAHEQDFTTEEFHLMCEEAPKDYVNGEWIYSAYLIQEWLVEVHGFCPIPYRATFHAY